MKITFQNRDYINSEVKNNNINAEKPSMSKGMPRENSAAAATFGSSINNIGNGFLSDNKKNSIKSLTELQQEAGATNVSLNQDYQTVLANTMSPEDYAKASEEGFDYRDMDYKDVVTIQDRIKAEMARSGEVIVGYNDDMSSEVLAGALGSESLARDLQKSFAQADIPMTLDNIDDTLKAWNYASSLEEVSEDEISYMVQNEMKPTIWNFYLAQSSGADIIQSKSNQSMTIKLADEANKKLFEQVTNMLKDAGYVEDTEEKSLETGLEEAQWLLDRELPVTISSIANLENIKSVSFPITEENFVASVTAAVSEGINPIYADLTETESIYDKAAAAKTHFFSNDIWEETAGNITARRQLEEIRLVMTAEVNLKLLESGISFDTTPMEDLIDALKVAEAKVAKDYFPELSEDDEAAVTNYRLMNEANDVIAEAKSQPLASVGMFMSRSATDVTIREFHEEGKITRDTYEKAGETYEALMTSPRADLGDNIKKAFGNARELAAELGIEPTEENIRSIRILGYNQMEINQENVDKVGDADEQVRTLVTKMTPASVLDMIRDGVNPLEATFDQLNEYFDSKQNRDTAKNIKDYSEFLYGLEMQEQITDEERESFIGVYRLLHQIDSLEHAAVGSVVNMEAELDFKNLLAAVRIRKLHGLDVSVDKNYGSASEIIRDSITITEQIAAAYKTEKYSEEVEDLRQTTQVSKEATALLENYGIAQSSNNLIAANNLLSQNNNLFEELIKSEKGKNKVKEIAQKAQEALDADDFDEEYKELGEELGILSEEMAVEAEKYIDVKALALVHRQLSIAKSISEKNDISDERDYVIPMEIGESVAKVHLHFVNDSSNANVSINVSYGENENLEAHFNLNAGTGLEGYIVGNNENELQKLESISDIFDVALKNNDSLKELAGNKIPVISRETDAGNKAKSITNNRSKDAMVTNSDGSERATLLQITKVFLQSVREA